MLQEEKVEEEKKEDTQDTEKGNHDVVARYETMRINYYFRLN